MGSSGGGTAGKVEYPPYLMAIHSAFLTNSEVDTMDFSMVDLFNDACADSPYATALSYTGRSDVGTVSVTIAQAIQELLNPSFDPLVAFQANLNQVADNINQIFSVSLLQTAMTQASDNANPEYNKMQQTYDFLPCGSGLAFSSARILSRPQVLDAKMRSVMTESLKELSKSMVQLNNNKLSDALSITETQIQNFKVSKTAYTMAVEMCKLTMLNEREYFEQAQYYAKYAAHWRFECMQECFNGLAVRMGKRLTWVPTADVAGWEMTLGLVAGYGVGDPIGTSEYKKSKRFRLAVRSGTTGAASGMLAFGPWGALYGVVTFATTYATYKEGEWR